MAKAPVLVAIMGPTASGKTAVAELLAERLDAQLINADAFLVYRGLDIGTAKPEHKDRYRLIDIKEPTESYGVGEFVLDAAQVINAAILAGKSVVVVGGTGLYVRALFEGYADLADAPNTAIRGRVESLVESEGLAGVAARVRSAKPDLRIDWANPVRVKRAYERILQGSTRIEFKLPDVPRLKFGIEVPVEELGERIDARVCAMIEAGWQHEVKELLENGINLNDPAMRAIGYSSIARLIAGELSLNEAIQEIRVLTRQYAKRQRSWLRNEPNLIWVKSHEDAGGVVCELLRFIGARQEDNKVRG